MPNLDSVPGSAPANGASSAHELFALSDEQILEIQPDAQDAEVRAPASESSAGSPSASTTAAPEAAANSAPTGPFTAPEEVRALAELYPGGLSQAKTAAERARTLDEIDAAYFGGINSTPEQVSAARAQLAQRMMNENPAAFREMVFAGLRALEQASPGAPAATPSSVVTQHAAPLQENAASTDASSEPRAAYAAFERAANEELERGVGAAIERTIAQALPNLGREEGANSAGARGRVSGFVLTNPDSTRTPLRERLASSVRQDVEAALKGDRQLGEQIAQILAAKRFDEGTRAQVVRLIGERAQQLVPDAARRVIGEWTSTTLAAHGARSERAAASSGRREVAPAATASSSQARSERSPGAARDAAKSRGLDYRKLSDEQILDL